MKKYLLPRFIKAIAKCGDLDSSRYSLGGVCFERDTQGVNMIATDGKKIVVVRDTSDGAKADATHDTTTGTVIPGKPLMKIRKSSTASVTLHSPSFSTKGNTLTYGTIKLSEQVRNDPATTQNLEQIDHRFPRWRDVIHGDEKATQVALNPKLLRDLLDVYIEAGCESVTIAVPETDPTSRQPSTIVGKTSDWVGDEQHEYSITSLLMPMATDKGKQVHHAVEQFPAVDFNKGDNDTKPEDKPELSETARKVLATEMPSASKPIDPPTQEELEEEDAEDESGIITGGVPELMSSKALAAAIQ